jgi:hypothetical protein
MNPVKTALILRAIVVASELGKSWSGNQEQQNNFSKLLESLDLKMGGNQVDLKSGGARTYESQLISIGLLYKDKSSGELGLTQAGEDLMNLHEPALTFEYQILKFQYPSLYSMSRNVDLNKDIKIRPFLFLLKLAGDSDLNGLSDEDIMIPVVFGANDVAYDLCKEKILLARMNGVSNVIPDDNSIRTSKTLNNTYSERIKDIADIANTFRNVLQGAGLIEMREVDRSVRVFPRAGIAFKLKEVEAMPYVDFLSLPAKQASMQYGKRFGQLKDTRRILMPSKNPELFSKNTLIVQRFLEEVELPVTQVEVDNFVSTITQELRVNKHEVINALAPILNNPKEYSGARLLELAKGGVKYAEAFEKNVAKIFKLDFGYGESIWTGRMQRERTGGYMDIFVVETGRNACGIIDAKSSKYPYDLPHDDAAKCITTYIDAAGELYGNRNNLDLKFVAYISHVIGSGASTRAQDIYLSKGIPVSLISAYGLNFMRESSLYKGKPSAVTDLLSKNPVNLIETFF